MIKARWASGREVWQVPRVRRTSQADVAKRAGVSPGVVSAVINNRDYGSIRISDATRERVHAAVRELGYLPNLAARNLARGSNRLLGVFTFEPLFPLKPPNFYHEFLVGIEEAADAAEYNLLLLTGAKDEGNRRSIFARGVNNLQLADGALLLGTHEDTDQIVRLSDEGYPFVFVGQREFEGCEVSYVAADYLNGTADLVRRAAAHGHRKMIMLIPSGKTEPYPGRRAGFLAGVRDAGLSAKTCQIHALVEYEDPAAAGDLTSEATAATDLDAVLDRITAGEVTAVLVEQTEAALELKARCEAAGLSVPQDVSIIGLRGGGSAPETSLTELNVPRYQMGQEATRMLLSLLEGPPSDGPIRRTLPCGEPSGSTLGPAPRRRRRK